ncbi:MAG: hypothetical protein HY553_07125 [Elusimicrobia bacterium]|nr:hypothetical protein [Elusimicrobiota bacterium]
MNSRPACLTVCLLLSALDAHALWDWNLDGGGGEIEPRVPRPRITLEVPNEAGVVAPGKVKISVKATAPGGLDVVTVFVDNEAGHLCRAWTLQFECEWDASKLGPHTIRGVVRDEEGEEAEARLGVVVDSRLRVEFVEAPSGRVSGEYALSARASSPARIRFFVDLEGETTGVQDPKECASATTCSTRWSTAGLPDGRHAVVVTAQDAWGKNVYAKTEVTVAHAALEVSAKTPEGGALSAKVVLTPRRGGLAPLEGTTPHAFRDLFAGWYSVDVTLAGHKATSQTIELKPGDRAKLEAVLPMAETPAARPPQIKSFTADDEKVSMGGKTTLRWQTEDATACTLDGAPVQGASREVTLQVTTEFVLSCSGPGGPDARAVKQVRVEDAPSTEELDCRDFKVVAVTSSTISVSFDSVIEARGRAEWYLPALEAYPGITPWDSPNRRHVATITRLSPGTEYRVGASVLANGPLKSCAGQLVTTDRAADPPASTFIVTLVEPAAGQVSGTVNLIADARDPNDINAQPARVEFFANGSPIGTTSEHPCQVNPVCHFRYRLAWDTTAKADGSYALLAKAFDSAGRAFSSDGGVTVSIKNQQPPGVFALDAPVAGATLTGPVTVAGVMPCQPDQLVSFAWSSKGANDWQEAAPTVDKTCGTHGDHPNTFAWMYRWTPAAGDYTIQAGLFNADRTQLLGVSGQITVKVTSAGSSSLATASTPPPSGATDPGGPAESGAGSSRAVLSPANAGAGPATIAGRAARRATVPAAEGLGEGGVSLVISPRLAGLPPASIGTRPSNPASYGAYGAPGRSGTEGNSLSSCGGHAPSAPGLYGPSLEPFAPALLREYEAIAAETEAGRGVRTLGDCLSLGARLAYAMKFRLPELGAACGVGEWENTGPAHRWEDLEAVGEALKRCGDDAVFGVCPNCGLDGASGLGK